MPFSWQPWGAGSSITGLPSLAEAEPPFCSWRPVIFKGWLRYDCSGRLRLAESPQRGYWGAFRLSVIAATILTLFLSGVLGEAFYIAGLRQQSGASAASKAVRHLSPDQRARMRLALRVKPTKTYYFDINSLPDCDECEQFAEEIRAFINSVPGLESGWCPNDLSAFASSRNPLIRKG